MVDFFLKKCFNHKTIRSKTQVAKYNKLKLISIPLVAQINLKKILNQLVFSAILKPPTNVSVGTPPTYGYVQLHLIEVASMVYQKT